MGKVCESFNDAFEIPWCIQIFELCNSFNSIKFPQTSFPKSRLTSIMSFTICLNIQEMSLYLTSSFFCIPNAPNWTVGHSSCIDGTCLFFILERMLVKKLWNLSSAISVERRVHPVQVKCFPLSWLYINQILACFIQQKIFKKPLHILQGIMSALLLPLLWVLLFHHLYVPNKVALTNEILPSIACFSVFFKKEHDFFNIFSTGWFQIICQLMFKKCLQQINICSLCPQFVISTAPKLLVRNIETKETFKKLRVPVFKIISTNLETVTLAFAPAFLKFSGTIKSFNSPTLSARSNLHKHLSLQHFWVP